MNHSLFIFLIKKQIWVAICFVMLCLFFQLYLNAVDYPLLIILFFSTISMYNLAIQPKQQLTFNTFIWIVLPLLASVILGFLFLNLYTIICLAFLALLSTQYSVSIFGEKFRNRGRFKIFIISIVWASAIILTALIESEIAFKFKHFILCISAFLFTFAISIPFDLRDRLSDDITLKTFPQLYGVERSLRIAHISLVLSTILFLSIQEDITNIFTISFLGGVIYALAIFKRSSHFYKKYYVSFWVESISLIPFLLYSVFYFTN